MVVPFTSDLKSHIGSLMKMLASHSEVKGERNLMGTNCYTNKADASSR